METAKVLLEDETGLEFSGKVAKAKAKGIYPITISIFYELALHKALGIKNETNLEERLIDTPDGYVRNGPGGTVFTYSPGNQQFKSNFVLSSI